MHNWDTLTRTRPSIAQNQFSDSKTEFNKWPPWTTAQQADLTQTPVMIISGLMVDFADRYSAFLHELGAQVTRFREDCFHEMKCLALQLGEEGFAFIDRMIPND